MNNELIERIDIELTGLQSVLDGAKAAMPYERFAEISSPMDVLRDCKAALTQQQEAEPVPTGDERSLQRLGDEIHNASCTVIHLNEEIGEHLGQLASELWNWEKTHPPAAQPCWRRIEDAPKDNKRPLYLARFNDAVLTAIDFNGAWDSETDDWEFGAQRYYYWSGEYGSVEEPTHWAYQDEPLPADAAQSQVPVGEVLVPVELIKFIEAKEHHLPIEDRHVLSAMLSAHKEQS